MTRAALAALCATLVVGACSSVDQRAQPEETMDQPSESVPVPGASLAHRAVSDLAERLDLSTDEVVVERVEEVTWRDGSLGCAEKGMMYTQALVDGTRIVLRAGGETYEYHAGGRRGPFLCERPTQ